MKLFGGPRRAAREHKLSVKHYDQILLLPIFRYIYNISICVGDFKSRYPPILQIQYFFNVLKQGREGGKKDYIIC